MGKSRVIVKIYFLGPQSLELEAGRNMEMPTLKSCWKMSLDYSTVKSEKFLEPWSC